MGIFTYEFDGYDGVSGFCWHSILEVFHEVMETDFQSR